MDDAKIDLIAREVLTSLKRARAHEAHPEAPACAQPEPAATGAVHPSLRLLAVIGGAAGSACVIEPGKVCVASQKCRSFGH